MRISIASILIAAAAAACSGTTVPEQHYDTHSHGVGEKHDMEEEHHGVGIAEIDAFHDTLAPIWHAPAGDDRRKRACDEVPTWKDQAVQAVGRARTDHAGWEGNANALAGAIGKLGDACRAGAGVDDAFSGVHDAYHSLMQAAMGGQDADHAHIGH